MRVIKGRPLTLSHTFLDDDEETPLTLSAVSVTLVDAEGVEGVPVSATGGELGVWSVSFPTQPLGVYRVVWDGGTVTDDTTVEVVGGFLFTVPEARNSDDYLSDSAAFPAAEIIAYREVVESEFQDITARSFTPRVKHVDFVSDGSGEFVALIPDAQEVEAVWVNGDPVADISVWRVNRLGKVTCPVATAQTPVEGDSVRVRVRYGYATPPADIKRVGMVRLRALMAAESSGIPDRATTWQPEEGGTFRLATPGSGPWETGIPEVDAALKRYTLDTVLAVYAGG